MENNKKKRKNIDKKLNNFNEIKSGNNKQKKIKLDKIDINQFLDYFDTKEIISSHDILQPNLLTDKDNLIFNNETVIKKIKFLIVDLCDKFISIFDILEKLDPDGILFFEIYKLLYEKDLFNKWISLYCYFFEIYIKIDTEYDIFKDCRKFIVFFCEFMIYIVGKFYSMYINFRSKTEKDTSNVPIFFKNELFDVPEIEKHLFFMKSKEKDDLVNLYQHCSSVLFDSDLFSVLIENRKKYGSNFLDFIGIINKIFVIMSSKKKNDYFFEKYSHILFIFFKKIKSSFIFSEMKDDGNFKVNNSSVEKYENFIHKYYIERNIFDNKYVYTLFNQFYDILFDKTYYDAVFKKKNEKLAYKDYFIFGVYNDDEKKIFFENTYKKRLLIFEIENVISKIEKNEKMKKNEYKYFLDSLICSSKKKKNSKLINLENVMQKIDKENSLFLINLIGIIRINFLIENRFNIGEGINFCLIKREMWWNKPSWNEKNCVYNFLNNNNYTKEKPLIFQLDFCEYCVIYETQIYIITQFIDVAFYCWLNIMKKNQNNIICKKAEDFNKKLRKDHKINSFLQV